MPNLVPDLKRAGLVPDLKRAGLCAPASALRQTVPTDLSGLMCKWKGGKSGGWGEGEMAKAAAVFGGWTTRSCAVVWIVAARAALASAALMDRAASCS